MSDKGGLIFLGFLGLLGAVALVGIVISSRQRPISSQLPQAELTPATYENEETWDLQYTEEGLIKKVVVHRRAVQT